MTHSLNLVASGKLTIVCGGVFFVYQAHRIVFAYEFDLFFKLAGLGPG